MKPLKISEINAYINKIMKMDPILKRVSIVGELSSFKAYPSGHIYMTFKDDQAQLPGIMYKWQASAMSFLPKVGMEVEAQGQISIYEKTGKLQMVVEEIKPRGQGALYEEFLRIKGQLEKEGLFDMDRKRPLPKYPERVGLVTSLKAAALQDFLKVLARRNPGIEVVLSPSSVQGPKAPEELIQAFLRLDKREDLDLIVVTRGGGSIEDLWAFNDENLARALDKRRHPLVAAIGHEVDFTIIEMVADRRASTPSVAAEMISRDRQEWVQDLDQAYARLVAPLREKIKGLSYDLDKSKNRMDKDLKKDRFLSEKRALENRSLRIHQGLKLSLMAQDQALGQARLSLSPRGLAHKIDHKQDQLEAKKQALTQTLRGLLDQEDKSLNRTFYQLDKYADGFLRHRVYRKDGGLILRAQDVQPEDEIRIDFIDGLVGAKINYVEEKESDI